MTENRHGLVVQTEMTQATGTAEREAAKLMIEAHAPGSERRITVGADKGYDTAGFVADSGRWVTPHVAQNNKGRASAIDARTTRHPSPSARKSAAGREPFGWARRSAALPARCVAVRHAWASCSRSRWPPTISSDCPGSSHRPPPTPEHKGQVPPARHPSKNRSERKRSLPNANFNSL